MVDNNSVCRLSSPAAILIYQCFMPSQGRLQQHWRCIPAWHFQQPARLQSQIDVKAKTVRHKQCEVCFQARLTSSVSYVTASSSRQFGAVLGLACLPHIVIRPPNLVLSTSNTVTSNLECLKSEVNDQSVTRSMRSLLHCPAHMLGHIRVCTICM